MNHADYFMLSLCLWREARGEGSTGMTAVGCVVRNRALKNSSFYAEIVKPWQFTSISVKTDPEIALWPSATDAQWLEAQQIAQGICDGTIQDVTGGATLYWNPRGIVSTATFTLKDGSSVKFPQTWNAAVISETVQIGAHIFLKTA